MECVRKQANTYVRQVKPTSDGSRTWNLSSGNRFPLYQTQLSSWSSGLCPRGRCSRSDLAIGKVTSLADWAQLSVSSGADMGEQSESDGNPSPGLIPQLGYGESWREASVFPKITLRADDLRAGAWLSAERGITGTPVFSGRYHP